MKSASWFARVLQQEDLNFVLTNRVPRTWLTWLVGCISKSEHPWVRSVSIGLWRRFADVDLTDARTTTFRSMHDCFTRQLRDGARTIDPAAERMTSPCDGIVGACGRIERDTLLQAKGFSYTLMELLGDAALAQYFRDGRYVTLRLTAGMYHRFHAPHACTVEQVTYFPGELWNVNPPTLKRISKLFCKNERAVLRARLDDSGEVIALVPVAAILVASIRLHFLDVTLGAGYRGPHATNCSAHVRKGEEMGWFEHGSTIILLAPRHFQLLPHIRQGETVRMGVALMRVPQENEVDATDMQPESGACAHGRVGARGGIRELHR